MAMGTDPEVAHDAEGVHRLTFFSDAVFAIAMTILVLDLKPPSLPPHPADSAVWHALALWHDYAAFVISFLVIGTYWAAHHRAFRHLVGWDGGLVWLNLLLLLGITFVPFATAVFADYPGSGPAVLVYAATLAGVGLVWAALWGYAAHDHRLVAADLTPAVIRRATYRALVPGLVFLASLPVAWLAPRWAPLLWLGLLLQDLIGEVRGPGA